MIKEILIGMILLIGSVSTADEVIEKLMLRDINKMMADDKVGLLSLHTQHFGEAGTWNLLKHKALYSNGYAIKTRIEYDYEKLRVKKLLNGTGTYNIYENRAKVVKLKIKIQELVSMQRDLVVYAHDGRQFLRGYIKSLRKLVKTYEDTDRLFYSKAIDKNKYRELGMVCSTDTATITTLY